MSLEATTWALTSTVGDARTKLVLYGLANHAHADGRNAWPSIATLADYAECDARTVKRQLKRLQADGWIRLGDQQQVAHLRADRRPLVYDLAMSEAVRARWAAEQGAPSFPVAAGIAAGQHGEQQPVDDPARGDNLSPRQGAHGVTSGVTSETPRGDTAMSPEPSLNLGTPPNPLASEGAPSTTVTSSPSASGAGCRQHGPTCRRRACGTSPRAIVKAAETDAAARRRAADQAASAASRAARAAAPPPDPTNYARARAAIAAATTGAPT